MSRRELIAPRSSISGAVPEEQLTSASLREARRFSRLPRRVDPGAGSDAARNRELAPRHLSFRTPCATGTFRGPLPISDSRFPTRLAHFFYVWLDAPIGYIASTKEWCDANGESLDRWWRNPDCEIHHFIGKDIAYFHTLFWPAMLKSADFQLPTNVHVHGFLTVNGEKMSKRKGTFVLARTYLDHLSRRSTSATTTRASSRHRVDDLDLNLDEFVQKVNSDLVGKVVNLASRTARFVKDRELPAVYPAHRDEGLFEKAARASLEIAEAYEARDTSRAMRTVMALADRANEFVEAAAPWTLKKDPDREEELLEICAVALNLFRQLTIYLAPVLPRFAEESARLLSIERPTRWEDASTPVVGTRVTKFKHLMERVDPEKVAAMREASREAVEQSKAAGTSDASDASDASREEALAGEPVEAECTIDDFTKVDLRVAEIISAQAVPKANKLLRLELSLGGDERRMVFAGIKKAYEPEALVGRLTVVVANLAPRTMKFGTSEGMVLAAGSGDDELFILSPDSGAKPGQRIR